ncbi:MAG TPA: hypothetical protein VNO52_06790, partial [Methylomirabilota bacterium]|nr:hypothetical protein [Methylomirabilota bacterium]
GCQIYTLTNYTTAPLEWSAVPGEPWLEVSPAGGTLAGRSSVQVTVCVAPEAGNFDLGNRSATVTFSNHVSGVAQSRAAGLRVMAFAPMPFLDDFESGRFQSHWNIAGTGAARAQVTEASAPHAGRFHLTLDGAGVNEFSRNEVTLGLDLAGYSNVVLRFVARNIGDEADAPPASPFRDGADFDGVAISADGVLWYEVQPLRYIPTRDTQFVVHLDEVMVAHGLSYTPAFRIRFNQFDDYAIPFDGLALDNVSVTGDPVRRLALHLPLELPENAGVRTNAAAVRLSVPAPADVVLQLRSGNPARLQVPTTVVLPAGATEAFFDLSALDNERLDGAEPVSVAAVAEGYFVPPASLTVLDDEQARLRVRAPVSGREGEGLRAGAGRVILDARPTRDLVVALTATPAEAVWVPPFVTVPAGQKGVDFDVIINDDTKLDGWEQAVLIARVPGWPEGRATFYIEDDDVPGVTVELPDSISEAAEATSIRGTVRLRAGFSTNVVVSLLSDNPRRLRVPAAVEIAAGQLSAEFALEPMDDRLITGPVSVVVSAGACGLRPATATVRILDDEIPVVPYAPRPSEGEAGVSPRADLAWRSGVGDIAVNGGFEAGSFAGWHQKNDGYGTWVINDGTFDPEGPEGPTPPREGAYSVLTQQIGAGDHVLYQDVALPADLRSARWSWWQRVRNHGAEFVSPNQEFRAEVRDTNDVLLAVAFASRREDPLLGPWEERSFDLSPWRGRTVRLAYVQHDNLGYFNVHLDSIRVHLTASGEPVFDVFFGTTTNLGAAAWAGTTATPAWALPELDLDTTYYWRVVSRMGGARAESPVWSFTTRSVGPLHRFAWSWIPSPQPLGQAIPVTLTAQDDLGETVTNFHGAVALTGLPGNGNAGAVVITEIDAGNDDRVEFANAAGRPVDISDWEVVFYEVRSWPAPHFTFRIPAGTVCEPGDLFLVTMRGAAPGDYPFFFTGTNLNWSAFRLNNPIAVLLRDRAGVIVDFACAVDANPGRIAQPAPVPGAEWLGNPITANTNTGWSYQRVGSLDHNDASDWIVGPATPGLRNEGLQLPFPPRATVSISPDVASNFVNGVWTGTVTVREPAPLMTLQAVSDDGPLGFSDSFTVTAANDVAIAAVVNPNLPIVGDEVTYTFTVDNSGPDRSGAVRLRYQPVAGSVFASAHASQGSCAREGDAVVCDLGSVEAGLPAIVAARFQVLTPGPATGEVILEMESPD